MAETTEEQKAAHVRRKEARLWLRRTFPKAFPNNGRLALKIGIHQDILDLNLADAPPKRLIRHALSFYANLPSYLRAIVTGAPRVNLNGDTVGEVTAQEAQGAVVKTKKYQEQAHLVWLEKKKLQRQEAEKRKATQRAAATLKATALKKTQINEKSGPKLAIEKPITAQTPKPAKFDKILTLKKKTITTQSAT